MVENMEWYRAFYFTAVTGSLSKAAEELFITQPAVSYSIKQLETRLGGRLFFRTPKGVKLTAEGAVLFQYIEQAYHFVTAGEKQIAAMHHLLTGEIRIGASDTLCKHYLMPYVEAFHQNHPDIKIKVTNRTSQESIELLKRGKVDLAVVNLPLEDKQVTIRESLELQDCFVAGPAYRELADRGPISLETLLSQPLILLEQGSSTRRYFDRYVEAKGLEVQPEIELGSIDLMTQFARIGLGIACVIRNFVEEELSGGALLEIRLEPGIPPRSIGIAVLKEVPLSSAAQTFVDMLPLS
ncbi:LysR family transcriptional regulator [Paenibacillus sp. J2TS4]|uniref:LysR family transcriptional regulator n=1 Tax=Paenibacillus sp. J2TS4 TaxID=2807194 RepID=UPI001B22187A|nr:LysR family transcriptional regulator [Paenibacillus sp. J2TS4]GIP36424.1 LysR family transcriptional regulator [Paenibacillus sp. J2TS4]